MSARLSGHRLQHGWLILLTVLTLAAIAIARAQKSPAAEPKPGSEVSSPARPFVVVLALDGFRFDYTRRFGATHFLAMAAAGASAPDGTIPVFPAQSAPNLYTLATGLYPEHHGIVADSFYDEDRTRQYSAGDPHSRADARWYGGTPLWVAAEQAGMHTACWGWTGCEAAIGGVRPTYSPPSGTEERRDPEQLEQVLAFLRMPAAERPHLILVSLDGVRKAARVFGPESAQARASVLRADAEIGKLRAGIAALQLPVDLVVVSDAGLLPTKGSWIDLDSYASLSGVVTDGALLYPGDEAGALKLYQQLKIADARFAVYRRANLPAGLHANSNARLGDPVIVPLEPVAIRARAPEAGAPDRPPDAGSDGPAPGIFYAEGPDVRAGVQLKPFANTAVYPFLAQLLRLAHGPVDGSEGVLSGVLKVDR